MISDVADRIDLVFLSAIASVTVLSVLAELRAVWQYEFRACQPTAKAVRLLRSHLRDGEIPLEPLDERVVRWLLEHLDGTLDGRDRPLFRPRRQRHRFVLLAYPRLLGAAVPRSPVAFVPTFLTALGVLGTFTGIYLGLQQVSLEAIASTDALLATSTQLLAGMKVAFFTSLCGLGGASLLVLVLAAGERVRLARRNRLRSQLAAVAFLQSPTALLAQVATELRGTRQRDDSTASTLATLQQIRELQAAQLQLWQRSPLGQDFGDRLRETLEAELIRPLTAQLTQNAAATERTEAAIARLSDTLSESLDASLVQLAGATAQLGTAQQETLTQLGQFCDRLDSALERFQTQTQTAFDRSTEMQRSLLDDVQQRTADILQRSEGTFSAQAEILQSVGDETVRTMAEARSQLTGSLENIDAMLQGTRDTVEAELERFRLDYQYALDRYFSQQNELLKATLVKQRQTLEAAGEAFVSELRSQLPAAPDSVERSGV